MIECNCGTILSFSIKDTIGKIVDLSNATVKITLKNKLETQVKNCTIVDASMGLCQIVLSKADTEKGNIRYQIVVYYNDGREFACEEIGRLPTRERLK